MKNYDDFLITSPEKMDFIAKEYQNELNPSNAKSPIIDIKNARPKDEQNFIDQNSNSKVQQDSTSNPSPTDSSTPQNNNEQVVAPARHSNNNVVILLIILILLHNRWC